MPFQIKEIYLQKPARFQVVEWFVLDPENDVPPATKDNILVNMRAKFEYDNDEQWDEKHGTKVACVASLMLVWDVKATTSKDDGGRGCVHFNGLINLSYSANYKTRQ